MPPTLHKLLVHGPAISENLELPIGYYSEEAQEAQNKVIRHARLPFMQNFQTQCNVNLKFLLY